MPCAPYVEFEIILPLLCFLLDPLTNRFQDILKVKNPGVSARQRPSNYLESSKENVLGEYDAATWTMVYLKVLHDMISQNSLINF